MNDDAYYQASIEQRERLRAKLEALPEYRQLQAVEAVIRAYEAIDASVQILKDVEREISPTRRASSSTNRALTGHGKKSGPIIDAAEKYLEEKGMRAQSGEIARVLMQQGVAITGKSPSAVVSSYLSHNDRFTNEDDERGKGYGLRRWGALSNPSPSEEATSAPGFPLQQGHKPPNADEQTADSALEPAA